MTTQPTPDPLTYGRTGIPCGCGKDAHSNLVPCQPDEPQTLTPEIVNAIVRDPDSPYYPTQITVFCDHCGAEETADYMVHEGMTSTQRLAVARQHLVKSKGWEHTEDGDDFCPTHAAPAAAETGE
ncbi:hypothetical protein [Streptomyces sp.]|uniref:hypothetical protein n=1 Tax=Streptomyces sp. TaxID=1931 RepID=UPI002D402279|nr:hypothetical protein [Streptomyces sp.]HZF92038.1 hypothetical protein [Streptomyces sp.]